MNPELFGLALLFAGTALVYASAGFGGGSAYLALLTLAGVPLADVAPVALVCNIIVVAGGSWQFVRAGHLRLRLFIPFVLTSLPAAYLGGYFRLEMEALGVLTGLALGGAAALLVLRDAHGRVAPVALPRASLLWPVGIGVGALLGGLSGMIGIGGGIFLAPVLHLLRWGTAQEVAAVASVFILANSVAGLLGQASASMEAVSVWAYSPLFVAVLAGGQVGSRIGAWRLPARTVRRVTATIVLIAALNLLWS